LRGYSQVFGNGLSDIGKAASGSQVYAGLDMTAVDQERNKLSGVIGAVADGGIAAVIGADY